MCTVVLLSHEVLESGLISVFVFWEIWHWCEFFLNEYSVTIFRRFFIVKHRQIRIILS
jgi:hypothetical protein